jgi:hypothetical protein
MPVAARRVGDDDGTNAVRDVAHAALRDITWLAGPRRPDLCTTHVRSSSSRAVGKQCLPRFRRTGQKSEAFRGRARARIGAHRSGHRRCGRREVRSHLAVKPSFRFLPDEESHLRGVPSLSARRPEERFEATQRLAGQQRIAEARREPRTHGPARTEAGRAPRWTAVRSSSTAPPSPSGRDRRSPVSVAAGSPRSGRPPPGSPAEYRSGTSAPPAHRKARTRAP